MIRTARLWFLFLFYWFILIVLGISMFYKMALSHKDWELPKSRIWLAEIDIDRGLLDFPI